MRNILLIDAGLADLDVLTASRPGWEVRRVGRGQDGAAALTKALAAGAPHLEQRDNRTPAPSIPLVAGLRLRKCGVKNSAPLGCFINNALSRHSPPPEMPLIRSP